MLFSLTSFENYNIVCEIVGVLCRHFLESSVNIMAIAALSLLRHRLFVGTCHVYKEMWSPSIGEKFECSITGSSWLIMSKSDDISKRNTASLAIGATREKVRNNGNDY